VDATSGFRGLYLRRVPPLGSFKDASALNLQGLRAILGEGDAQERVWAAWALGLSLGKMFGGEAADRSTREPDPGVRRHLIVVLAGLGERSAVWALAAGDPDPYVRATAHRYAFQLSGPIASDNAVGAIVSAAMSDSSEIVREECLRLLENRWPHDRRGDLRGFLGDSALGVRQVAADRLADGQLSAADLEVLARRAIDEPDPDLRRRLMAMVVQADGGEVIAAVLRDLAPERLVELLDHLELLEARFSWHQLRAISNLGLPAIDRRLLKLLRLPMDADLVWLARCTARPLSWPSARNRLEADVARDVRVAADLARRALVEQVARVDPPPLSRDERDLFLAVIQSLRDEEGDLRAEQDDLMDDGEWDPAWLEQVVEQRRRLETFLEQSPTLGERRPGS
jgi:hypothetical protein